MKKLLFTLFSTLILSCFINAASASERLKASSIQSWGYQLQKSSVFELRQENRDLIVVDYLLNTDPLVEYQPRHLKLIKEGKNSDVKMLAYLSIGEAEDYRPYWKKTWKIKPPTWLGVENPDWKGNYKVRYWDPDWQAMILKELDRILKAGFDGVYMDIVDGFEYWGSTDVYQNANIPGEQPGKEIQLTNDPVGDERNAGNQMIQFLENIAKHARHDSEFARSHFLMFPQNGERLLEVASGGMIAKYWKLIDGIGVEDLFYYGENAENNPLNIQKERLKLLRNYPRRNKVVLNVEYINQPEWIKTYKSMARSYRFVPLTNVRSLDQLGKP